MKILITGATGFIGSKLVEQLLKANHQIIVLSRNKERAKHILGPQVIYFKWPDTTLLPPEEAFQGINGIINLMGENIAAKRWTDDQKKVLQDSRILASKNLIKNIINLPLDFFIQASAIGIYPVNLAEVLNEDSKLGDNFLAKLCIDWESPSLALLQTKRRVIIRTGVVLHPSGGALKKMLLPFLMGVGGPIGDGTQMMSWIHLEDHLNIFLEAINNPNLNGIINAVSPNAVTNLEFTKALGQAIKRPTFFKVPARALRLIFGEMASLMLDSQNITSKKLRELNFQFKRKTIAEALSDITN